MLTPADLLLPPRLTADAPSQARGQPGPIGGPAWQIRRDRAFISAADYIQALRARTAISQRVAEILGDVDAILSPTTARPAEAFAESDPESRFREPSFVNVYNLIGLPAISVPCGFSSAGLPRRAADRGGRLCGAPGAADRIRIRASHAVARASSADRVRSRRVPDPTRHDDVAHWVTGVLESTDVDARCSRSARSRKRSSARSQVTIGDP